MKLAHFRVGDRRLFIGYGCDFRQMSLQDADKHRRIMGVIIIVDIPAELQVPLNTPRR
jgi:hypothetical protein